MSEKIIQKKDLDKVREKGLGSLYPDKPQILVGMSSCGIGSGAIDVFWKIIDESTKRSLDAISVNTGCLGYCQKEPLVDVAIPGLPRVVYGGI
jgi:NADP-reducing hydrogenase subunit HndB